MATQSEVEAKQWQLEAESEVRFEVEFDAAVTIELLKGEAEVNGIELAKGRSYELAGCCFAVLSWRGATIESRGKAKSAYYAQRTTAASALHAHAFLEAHRERAARAAALAAVGGIYHQEEDDMMIFPAEEDDDDLDALLQRSHQSSLLKGCPLLPRVPSLRSATLEPFAAMEDLSRARGPRVVVAGGADSGKSTLVATLAAYAARAGREPIVVDLDPGLGDVGVPPGAVGALKVEKRSLSVEHGFATVECAPLSFWFGETRPQKNVELYRNVVDRVAIAVAARFASERRTDASGVIVNTIGWIDGEGLELLKHVLSTFSADVVLVTNHDRLYQDLTAAVPRAAVANLPRSGGLTTHDAAYKNRARHKRVHEYFYGPGSYWQTASRLAPSTLELRFRDLRLFKVLPPTAVDSMLPVGQASLFEKIQVIAAKFSADLVHSVLAVCHLREDLEGGGLAGGSEATNEHNPNQFLLDCAAAGFVVVSNVNLDRSTVTLLAPCSGDLPSNNLLTGNIEWVEGVFR